MKNRWILVHTIFLTQSFALQGRVKRVRIARERSKQPSLWWRWWLWGWWKWNQDRQASLCWTLLLQQAPWHTNWDNNTKVWIQRTTLIQKFFELLWKLCCREPCIGLCYLNKLRLSKGLSGIKWRRGWGHFCLKNSAHSCLLLWFLLYYQLYLLWPDLPLLIQHELPVFILLVGYCHIVILGIVIGNKEWVFSLFSISTNYNSICPVD